MTAPRHLKPEKTTLLPLMWLHDESQRLWSLTVFIQQPAAKLTQQITTGVKCYLKDLLCAVAVQAVAFTVSVSTPEATAASLSSGENTQKKQPQAHLSA